MSLHVRATVSGDWRFLKVLQKSCEKKKQRKYKFKLRKRARRYINAGKKADEIFANKINAAKQPALLKETKIQNATQKYYNAVVAAEQMEDLQDLYELSHYNMRVVINVVNQMSK